MFYLILFRKVHKRVFFLFLGKKLKEMYREQNYIFSFTFVYKSKTACLKKNPCKKTKKKEKKEKEKKKYPQTTFGSFFLDSEDFFFIVCPMVLVLFYFNGIILFVDLDLILGQVRSPGGGHSNPPLYSCLENPMERGA